MTHHALRTAVATALVASLTGCDGGSDPSSRPARLVADGPTAIAGGAGETSAPLGARVLNGRGQPVGGVVVGCTIISGGGSLAVSQATSNAEGLASCGAWTFATQPGTGVAALTYPGLDTVTFTATIEVGAPATVALERSLPATLRSGHPIAPQPIAMLHDQFGNPVARGNVLVTARSTTTGVTLSGAQVATDATGRARFTQLCVAGPAGSAAVSFESPGLAAAEATAGLDQDAGGTDGYTLEFGSGDSRVIVVDTGVRAFFPPVTLRDPVGVALCGDNAEYEVRSPSLLLLDGGASALAKAAGRTFVVARSSQYASATDSVLVHVAQHAGGPLLLTDLTTFSFTSGTEFDVRVLVDPRTTGAITAVTMDVTYPRASPGLLSLLSVIAPTGATINASTFAGLVRVTYVNASGVSALTEIARLRFRALSAVPNSSQLVLVPLQVVSVSLVDVTGITSAVNPPFVVLQ